jgi:hypothetical protein
MTRRTAAAIVVLLCMASGCTRVEGESSRPSTSADTATGGPVTVAVAPDRSATVAVGHFTVNVPQGASHEPTTLTATRRGATADKGVPGLVIADGIDVTLGTGQPTAPIQLAYRLANPLAAGSAAVIIRGVLDTERVIPLATAISADRMTITATTTHLSHFDLIVESVETTLASLFTTRGQAPGCAGDPPNWVAETTFLEPTGDPPVLTCVGRDPAHADVAVVKLTNNRGTGIAVTTSVRWRWNWSSGSGGIGATANELLTKVTDPITARTLYVMPGQQLHLGFDRPGKLPATITVQGQATATSFTYGLLWKLLDATPRPDKLRIVAAGAFVTVCAADIALDPLERMETSEVLTVLTGLTDCIISHYEDIITLIVERLSAYEWSLVRPTVQRAAILRKLNLLLTLAGAAWSTLEAKLDLDQDPTARKVTIFAQSAKPPIGQLILGPAGLGPLKIAGSTSDGAAAKVIVWNSKACSAFDPPSGRWQAAYTTTSGRLPFTIQDSGPQSVRARVATVTRIDVTSPAIRTAKGIHVGSTLDQLRSVYGTSVQRTAATSESEVWSVTDGGNFLAFELWLPGNYANERPGIGEMRAGPAYVGQAVFGGDDTAGGC